MPRSGASLIDPEQVLVEAAQLYALVLVDHFKAGPGPTVQEFNDIADRWIQCVVPEIWSSDALELVCGICAVCLDEEWIVARLGPIFQSLRIKSGSGRLMFIEYLNWRFELHADRTFSLEY